jgi:Arc/MetJ-type ribon-helix-helix transcriptional regulator
MPEVIPLDHLNRHSNEIVIGRSDDSRHDGGVQIAVTIPDEDVLAIDALVPERFSSRAEAVGAAVDEYLARLRADTIDEQFRNGYAQVAQSVDEIDSQRVTAGRWPASWEELAW